MARTVLRWILIALAVALVGPIVAWLCRPIRAVDGGLTATVLVNEAVGPAMLRSVLALAIVLLFGAGVSRLMGWRLGAFVAGCALAWPAWEHAGVAQLIQTMDDPGVMSLLAIEGGLVVGAAAAIAFAIHWVDPGIDHRPEALRGVVPGIGGLIASALAAATLASIAVLLVAQSELRAQAFAASVVGAIVAGTVARFVGPNLGPAPAMLGLTLAAIGAPLVTRGLAGPYLVESAYTGAMLNLGQLTPLMWASGALVGVPIGSTWAESMLERQPKSAAATR